MDLLDVLACPACRRPLTARSLELSCAPCRLRFPIESGIPLLFHPHDTTSTGDVTQTVKAFYEENPFPNYDDLDSRESLRRKAGRGLFARMLDEQLPPGALVLEAGCGTGQLSNFLGMHWNRRVIGADLCLNSLKLAHRFKTDWAIHNAGFLQMNLFRPPFREESFDVVISNGVLHHTSDPLGGFRSIAKLVKPNGLVLIGLYNTIGRLPTDFRRFLFRISADRLAFLDDHMRNRTYNENRKRAWFMDQYKHPRESKHTFSEVLNQWFAANGFEFLSSIPKIGFEPFTASEQLFIPHSPGTPLQRTLTEIDMLLRGGVDGALFIMVGRKKPQPAKLKIAAAAA